ncbi:hypothetical protein [Oleiagrimonas sp. C23AA]|uniref:hypothetical protein n=1 Tax=Oleiagrimonas sp. C23AA TaxID=2719047 RepID=UPI00141FDF5D|nr:hypothetical protein [Oleiagrimonas sp. C23AA]NII10478.1 hypothetical protein [Oleiagrimonas sp. C23AA]
MRGIVRRFAFTTGAMLLAGSAFAQQTVPEPSAPPPSNAAQTAQDNPVTPSQSQQTQPMASNQQAGSQSLSDSGMTSTTFRGKDGSIVTVNSGMPENKPAQPAPAFKSLDTNNDHQISKSEAAAYPLLANDFDYADSNHNGKISQSEYTHWKNMK